jgi:hypothetical protein
MHAHETPAITATLITPHTRPILRVTVGSATVEIPIDLNAVIGRTTGPIVPAVAREGARLMRRQLACAPVGDWRRTRPDAYTVAVGELPGRCETCVHGCTCRVGRDGCEHLRCPGVRSRELADSCPGAVLMTASARQLAASANR